MKDRVKPVLRRVEAKDFLDISVLLGTTFEGPEEARLVERLRKDGDMALELVAEDAQGIAAYIAFARMDNPEGLYSLSPVAVRQSLQGRGIGGDVVRHGLDTVRQMHDAKAVVVLGAPTYYQRFGFSLKAAENLATPFPKEYTMLYPIEGGTSGMSVALSYPAAFFPG